MSDPSPPPPGEPVETPWEPHLAAFGQFLRTQRRLANLSLRDMAERTKVSNAYLSQIERGLHQPSIRVLRSIAEALNLSADTLLTQAGMMDPPSGKAAENGAPGPAAAPGHDTEAAIRADPALSPAEQEALIQVYRSFVRDRSAD